MKKTKNNSGMSLIEILIATAIIVFGAVAIIQLYLTSINLSELNKENITASAHLLAMAEAIKCTPFNSVTSDFPDAVPDGPAGNDYATIVNGYVLTGEYITVTYVDTGSDPLEINIEAGWLDKRGTNRRAYLATKRTR
ncbi:MAG: type II secretion system protein [Candidatus Omnitrophota bacterium]